MSQQRRVLRVALTGGIATGKSYVLARLRAQGVASIDADVLAREAVEPGTPAFNAIVERFGSDVLAPSGGIDRTALAAVVFRDAAARRDLERIVHPVVRAAMDRWFASVEESGRHALAVADIPLLYETRRAHDFDVVVVTACPPEEQVRRVVARDGVTQDEARHRLAAQWPIEEKVRRAAYVIDTGGAFEETDRQVDAVLAELRDRAGRVRRRRRTCPTRRT